MLNRYFIHLAYQGTRFHGWQMQPNARTVQQYLQESLAKILRTPMEVCGCGRTDSGVHAREYFAHFNVVAMLDKVARQQLVHSLNGLMDHDIVVFDILPVHPEAHARFSALARTYEYSIITQKDPFLKEYAWHYPFGNLDPDMMNQAAALLLLHSDFACFSKKDSDTTGTLCTVTHSAWQAEGHLLTYTVRANRFLRNMVRAIVGTLVDIGKGRWDEQHLHHILHSKDRCQAGASVPAHGLALTRVEYPPGIFIGE